MATNPADWSKRLVAAAIDAVIVLVPSMVLGVIGYAVLAAALITRANQPGGFGESDFDGWQAAFFGVALVLALGNALYYALLHSRRGQTVGKMVMRIRVVDVDGLSSVRFGRALLRWLIPFGPIYLVVPLASFGVVVAFLWLLLDLLWPLWDDRRQALHDKVIRTSVIEAP